MSWKEWASISIPCGLVTALDVGLSNLALVSITLTFYTMVKSSTPVFVLAWAYLFKIERITWPLIGVILVIASGEFLTVFGEVDFVLHGFLLCLTASVLSGARWTLVQLKLQQLDPPLKSTIVTMKLLAPSMFWSMLIISMVVERPWIKLKEEVASSQEMGSVFLLGLLGGTFAVFMILCEFYLILKASAIILMIGGVIKELTTIFIGVSFFKDKLNLINSTGVAIVFSGVLLYKIVFHYEKKIKQQQSMEAIPSEEPEEETEFLDEELPFQQSLAADIPFKDHDSDHGLGDYHDKPEDSLRKTDPAVEMIKSHNDGPLHLRQNMKRLSSSESVDGNSLPDNGIV
jgi:solute carrier family 35 protein C2